MPASYPLPLMAPQDTPADLQIDPGTGRVLLPLRLTGDRVLHSKAATVTVFDEALGPARRRHVRDHVRRARRRSRCSAGGDRHQAVHLRLAGPGKVGHVINPVCTPIPGMLQDEDEGCLSIPGLYFPTPRAKTAVVRGVDADGKHLELEGVDLLARCFQHETDHLDGMLYVERLGGRVRKASDKAIKAAEWFGQTIKPLVPKALQEPADHEDDADDDL